MIVRGLRKRGKPPTVSTGRQTGIGDVVSGAHGSVRLLGGVPHRIILDNLKDGVLKPDLYDPARNRTYRGLAEHYGFLIDPGRVTHPRDNR